MSQTRISEDAWADLENILRYIAKSNVDAAIKHDVLLHDKIELLAREPKIGRERSDLIPGLRGFPVGNYTIFYTVDEGRGIDVLRVLHGRRNLPVVLHEKDGRPI